MIDIDYTNGIKITTGEISKIFLPNQLPLKVEVKSCISKKIVWSCDLNDNMWASYPENEINDVLIKDNQGNFITQYYWDIVKHGSVFYKMLWFYCKGLINNGIKPKGLVIGTHDGEFGEWVPLVRNFMSDMTLVEGSQKQFDSLYENYKDKQGIHFIHNIVTPNGGEVEFFEGGRGYTNSVVERVIKHWEIEEIQSTKKKSIGINDLIQEKIDWLHLDVEGLDAKLIMAIKKENLPNLIIFEDYNLLPEEKTEIYNWLYSERYVLLSDSGICSAIRN